MPLPLLVVGAIKIGVAVLGAGGAAIGVRGAVKIKKAKKIGKAAQGRHKRAISRVNARRDQVSRRAKSYGRYLLSLKKGTLTEMSSLLEALQKKTRIGTLKIPLGAEIQVGTLEEFRQQILDPPQDAAGVLGAASAGAAASSSTVGLVGLLGTASTGTAISGLSGAAATNATLAWLGGGSLATGGGGMAAGTVVLGGITIAPALIVGGFYLASKGEKALTEARRYEKKRNIDIEKLKTVEDVLKKIEQRIDELHGLAKKLNRHTRKAMAKINPDTFNPESDAAIKDLTTVLQLGRALAEIMRTPIINERGNINVESHQVYMKYEKLAEGMRNE